MAFMQALSGSTQLSIERAQRPEWRIHMATGAGTVIDAASTFSMAGHIKRHLTRVFNIQTSSGSAGAMRWVKQQPAGLRCTA